MVVVVVAVVDVGGGIEMSGGECLPARLVSDGTLRLLALLTALRAGPRASILAIEEPENSLSPFFHIRLPLVLGQRAILHGDRLELRHVIRVAWIVCGFSLHARWDGI